MDAAMFVLLWKTLFKHWCRYSDQTHSKAIYYHINENVNVSVKLLTLDFLRHSDYLLCICRQPEHERLERVTSDARAVAKRVMKVLSRVTREQHSFLLFHCGGIRDSHQRLVEDIRRWGHLYLSLVLMHIVMVEFKWFVV